MVYLSLGGTCKPSWHLRRRGEHHKSPFDRVFTPFSAMITLLKTGWKDFLKREYFEEYTEIAFASPFRWIHTRYRIIFIHDDIKEFESFVDKYQMKIDNFTNLCKEPVVFVRESGSRIGLEEVLELYPGSKAILINPGAKTRLKCLDTRIAEWEIKEEIFKGEPKWEGDTTIWDMILDTQF